SGSVRPPPQAAPLMNILNSRVFSGMRSGSVSDSMYNDVPVYDSNHDGVVWDGQRGSAYGEQDNRPSTGRSDDLNNRENPSSWRDDYDRDFSGPKRASTYASG